MTITATLPAVTAFSGTPPTTADPASFDSRADALLPYIGATLPASLNALVMAANLLSGQINDEATASASSASAASEAAVASWTAAAASSAGANFKGQWASLAGALSTPASVAHNGLVWILLGNLANVAAAVPGVSASWQCLQKGIIQVVTATSATAFSTTSNEFVDAGLSAVITPKSASSRILVISHINSLSAASANARGNVTRNGVLVDGTHFSAVAGAAVVSRHVAAIDSPGTTAALTYSVRVASAGAGSVALARNLGSGDGSFDSLILMEVL